MNLKISGKELARIYFPTREYFSEERERLSFQKAATILGGVLLLGSLLLFFGALLNQEELKALSRDITGRHASSVGGFNEFIRNAFPWNQLLFSVVWLAYVSAAGGFRYLALMVFGEKNRSMARVQSLSIYAALPLILIAAVAGFFSNLFPPNLSGAIPRPPLWPLALLILGLIWEAMIFIRASRIVFEQNAGRAVLTYVSSWVGFSLTCLGIVIWIAYNAMGGR